MNSSEVKEIVIVCKSTEKIIKEIKKGTSLTNPIKNDLILVQKAMAFEQILGMLKRYSNKK